MAKGSKDIITAWSDEVERMLRVVAKDGRCDFDDINLSKILGMQFKTQIDLDYLDIARIDKKNKSTLLLNPNFTLIRIKPKRFKFFKIRF